MKKSPKEQIGVINQRIKEIAGIYREAISKLGISENEFWVWYTLITMNGEYTQHDICGAWSLSKQTVNTIIKNMKAQHFVSLETVPGTRNRKIIRLTDEGRKYGENIIKPIIDAENKAFVKLLSEDANACAAALEKYIGLLKKEIFQGIQMKGAEI